MSMFSSVFFQNVHVFFLFLTYLLSADKSWDWKVEGKLLSWTKCLLRTEGWQSGGRELWLPLFRSLILVRIINVYVI